MELFPTAVRCSYCTSSAPGCPPDHVPLKAVNTPPLPSAPLALVWEETGVAAASLSLSWPMFATNPGEGEDLPPVVNSCVTTSIVPDGVIKSLTLHEWARASLNQAPQPLRLSGKSRGVSGCMEESSVPALLAEDGSLVPLRGGHGPDTPTLDSRRGQSSPRCSPFEGNASRGQCTASSSFRTGVGGTFCP